MSDALLEQTRALHEEVERLERLSVKNLQRDAKSHKERLHQDHRVNNMTESIVGASEQLLQIYEDRDNSRKDKIAALGGQSATGQSDYFSAFYDRLKEIREYHRRHPRAKVVNEDEYAEDILKEEPWVKFSGEETYGQCLDLQELYNAYLNSKFGNPIHYYAYLEEFSKPQRVARQHKLSKEYQEYLSNLIGYLRSFLQRTQPLQDLGKVFSKVETEFDRKHFAIGYQVTQRHKEAEVAQQVQAWEEVVIAETQLQRLCELLHVVIEETKAHVSRRQALAYEEMQAAQREEEEIQAEREEEEVQAESENDEEDQAIHDSSKLPIIWNGKRIPYWFYNLHELGRRFDCEICGNKSYRGRRAFERHFKKWRHVHGMRCLGIPNTKNFHAITYIKDAKALWEKIQERQGVNKRMPDLEEEYEVQDGIVYNKKTFADLQRQGLIRIA